MNRKEYLLDTAWACGLIITENEVVVDCAPIFRKFVGKHISTLGKQYILHELRGMEEK